MDAMQERLGISMDDLFVNEDIEVLQLVNATKPAVVDVRERIGDDFIVTISQRSNETELG